MSFEVLVIEDDHAIAEFLKRKLTRRNYLATIAGHQREAYRLLDTKRFDFALLDIRLPGHADDMDPNTEVGFAILQHIRERFSADQLPVIMMTAFEETSQTAVRALKMGANDYIQKPFEDSPISLDEKIDGLAQHMERMRAEVAPSPAEKRYRIAISGSGIGVEGIPINGRLGELLLLIASRTFTLTADENGEATTMKARDIAVALDVKESTVRQYVVRLRNLLEKEFLRRYQKTIDPQAIIRNTRNWSGYGVNFETACIARG